MISVKFTGLVTWRIKWPKAIYTFPSSCVLVFNYLQSFRGSQERFIPIIYFKLFIYLSQAITRAYAEVGFMNKAIFLSCYILLLIYNSLMKIHFFFWLEQWFTSFILYSRGLYFMRWLLDAMPWRGHTKGEGGLQSGATRRRPWYHIVISPVVFIKYLLSSSPKRVQVHPILF